MFAGDVLTDVIERYPNLMRQKDGAAGSGQKWTLENLRDGILYFYETQGRYPTSQDVDSFDYLPSSRAIQRTYGGIKKLRNILKIGDVLNYASGMTRALKAREADERAKIYEEEFHAFLISRMHEIRVHEHKVLRPGSVNCDFFIYTDEKNGIALDLFYAQDLFSAQKQTNYKSKRYASVAFPCYFIIVGNDMIKQKDIEKMIASRKTVLPSSRRVFTEAFFKEYFEALVEIKSLEAI